MIDWFNLTANALWILACSLALATLSYASWEAWQKGDSFRRTIGKRGFQTWLNVAGVLFCLGLAATSDALWERIVWAVLGGLFVLQVVLAGRSFRKDPSP